MCGDKFKVDIAHDGKESAAKCIKVIAWLSHTSEKKKGPEPSSIGLRILKMSALKCILSGLPEKNDSMIDRVLIHIPCI